MLAQKVTWIRFYPGGGGPEGPTFDVAVDRETAKPVFARYTVGGDRTIRFGRSVIVADSLPAGHGDFTPKPVPPRMTISLAGGGTAFWRRVSASRAESILGRPPVWLGARSAGLSFTGFPPAVSVGGDAMPQRRHVRNS